jgi:hypothetical protein
MLCVRRSFAFLLPLTLASLASWRFKTRKAGASRYTLQKDYRMKIFVKSNGLISFGFGLTRFPFQSIMSKSNFKDIKNAYS